MNQEQILEGNKLIADFLGTSYLFTDDEYELGIVQYHNNWTWLMPVVEKIEQLQDMKVWVSINGKTCAIYSYCNALRGAEEDNYSVKKTGVDKLQETWSAVIDFIEYYNTLKP